MAKKHGQMGSCISQRSAQQDALFPFPPPCRALHIVQVVVSYRLELCVIARSDQAKGPGSQVRSQVGEEEEEGGKEQRTDKQQPLYQRSPPSERWL